MIRVTIFKDSEGSCQGFCLQGHAGYADHGQDIVCAAVSVLALNTVNSIEAFTDDLFEAESDEEQGILEFRFKKTANAESKVLMKSMILGLESIRDVYGTEYIKILFKEV